MSTTTTLDIFETIASSPNHNTLAELIDVANLSDALRANGPFTIFAPTDDAFKKIPKDTLDAVMQNQHKLQSILKNHVVAGKYMSGDVVSMDSFETINGGNLQVNIQNGCLINDANISEADIKCTNGVIHVIDSVLLPD